MPRYNVYIRNEDWPAWEAIKDRPKWIHEHLMEDFRNGKGIHRKRHKDIASQGLPQVPDVMLPDFPCPGHPHMRINCGRSGCKY